MVSFNGCDLDNVPSSIYKSFGAITWLQINYGKLEAIHNADFKPAKDLKKINILGTKVGRISSKAFSELKNLEELTIENCEIGPFAEDSFDGLENLQKVTLKGNKYKQGTPSFSNQAVKVTFSQN